MKSFDLEDTVATALRELVTSGALTDAVKKQVGKTMADVVQQCLSSFSPFGKQLKETVATALSIDPKALGLNGYNQTVLAIIRERLDHAIETVGREKLAADLEKMLGTDALREMPLSVFIQEFKKDARSHYSAHGRCTIILETPEYQMRWLYLDRNEAKTKYQCEFQLLIGDDGVVHCCTMAGHDPKKSVFLGSLNGFSRRLFQIYAAGTRLVVDAEDFDTTIGTDEEQSV